MTERSGELKTSRRQASGWCCGVGRKPKSHLFGRLFTPPAQTSQDQWVFHATTTRLLDPVCGDMNYREASVRRLIATNEGLDVTAQTCTACTKYILARARAAARRARRSIGSCGQRGRRNDCGVAEDGMGNQLARIAELESHEKRSSGDGLHIGTGGRTIFMCGTARRRSSSWRDFSRSWRPWR